MTATTRMPLAPALARLGRRRSRTSSRAFYTQQGIPFKGTDFGGRSDYGPFIAAGIPSGGLFTGAEGIKTAEEAAHLGRNSRSGLRSVLPPGMRQLRQHQPVLRSM